MRKLRGTCILAVLSLIVSSGFVWGQSAKGRPVAQAGIDRLMAATGGRASVSINRATGTARFVRLPESAAPAAKSAQRAVSAQKLDQDSRQFLNQYSSMFGIRDANNDLRFVQEQTDRATRGRHLTYRQYHQGVPVFGGMLRTHFDAAGTLRTINGMTVPNIALDTTASYPAEKAAAFAVAKVNRQLKPKVPAGSSATGLFVYQAGLLKGVNLGTHLVWQIVVTNKADVREFVFVDAHNGKFVDQITGIADSLYRRAYDGANLPDVPPSYPDSPYWVEGDTFPTESFEANNMITASEETYNFYLHAFGRDSFDGDGATMDSIFNRGYECPNASWNGIFISFCPGYTTDDVTAHEWSHAYTEYTDGLIYAWQSGALNESYSDIWGEIVDRINNRETDTPDTPRTGACSTFSPPKGVVTVDSPAAIVGDYSAQSAQFGPQLTTTGVSGSIAMVDPPNACAALTNAADIAGKIALIDRGTCNFAVKVKIAQDAGAVAAIVVNNAAAGLPGMGGTDSTITIPSVGITRADGLAIKDQLSTGVTATLHGIPGTDESVRWLVGEDVETFDGKSAMRDMSNPTCYSNPGKVSDLAYYVCDTADQGGVHTNSGVPNHAFALVVDGGTYNGQTVAGIGFNKAAAIYWRAQSVYQTPTSDFRDHADALEQSCTDLVGQSINDVVTGEPASDLIATADCQQIEKAMLAVEMRSEPVQCGFLSLLEKDPPARCEEGQAQVNLFKDTFETRTTKWRVSHEAVGQGFVNRDWQIVGNLPDGRPGHAFFGVDPLYGYCPVSPEEPPSTEDQSGVLHLDSPPIRVPEGAVVPLLTFDHNVATELGWDGGNLKVSVDGGPWTLVPYTAFTYNTYSIYLADAEVYGNTNPMAGETAFSGTDDGSNSGSWGRSHVDLTGIAAPGQTVRLRYDLGTDTCNGRVGWYLDDVTLYTCVDTRRPYIDIQDAEVMEGSSYYGGYTDMVFNVTLSHPTNRTVYVRYATVGGGTATPGVDYLPASGQLAFAPLAVTKQIHVRVRQDRIPENEETVRVRLLRPTNAVIGKSGQATGYIYDDDGYNAKLKSRRK